MKESLLPSRQINEDGHTDAADGQAGGNVIGIRTSGIELELKDSLVHLFWKLVMAVWANSSG